MVPMPRARLAPTALTCILATALGCSTTSHPAALPDADDAGATDAASTDASHDASDLLDASIPDATTDASCACDAGPSHCDAKARCLTCLGDGDCAGSDAGAVCVTDELAPGYGLCVPCRAAADCTATDAGDVCDLSQGTACIATPSCTLAPDACAPKTCDAVTGACRCDADAQCTDPMAPFCDVASGVCIQCRSPSDCGIQNGGCFWGECGTCGSDEDCPGTQRCNQLGIGAGYCGCSTVWDCGGNAPQCLGGADFFTGTCGCCADQQCPMGWTCTSTTCPTDIGICVP
jgi:hypothetical protein